MNTISESSKTIKGMYDKLTYFDQYGGSVCMLIILCILLFVAVSYIMVMRNIQPIKDDWPNQRCKPQVIPFAGLINKPPNMTIVEFTGQNFQNCMQNILVGVTGEAVQPITYMTMAVTEVFQAIAATIQNIRIMLSSIRSSATNIATEIMGRLANIMVPIQQILISFKDSMEKVKGILTAGLYTSLGTYYALKAMLGAIVQFIVIILIVLAALIVSMWIVPFTWPVAASMTAIFISISIPLAIIIAFMVDVLHIQTNLSIPGVPATPNVCFDPNTQLLMKDGTYKKISDIEVGDILDGNNTVTAKMKLNANKQDEICVLKGTLVTPEHKVLYNGSWIPVCKHPDTIFINHYTSPYLYCINTSSKKIQIDNMEYLDWDEIDERAKYELCGLNSEFKVYDMHTLFDSGFCGSTRLFMNDGSTVFIKDIQVGDILENSIQVIGVVEIDNCKKTNNLFHFDLGNGCKFDGDVNLHICDKNLEEIFYKQKQPTQEKEPEKLQKESQKEINTEKKLFHLITQEEIFYVQGIKFFHYNSNIELLLDKYRKKLLSMKYV
uniref:Vint domain-containing protein n=1 Tax=viral metagenome TaxID=1070528 RepID=A0A6C0AZ74_9ZZZZ